MEALADKRNNGGYEANFDPTFFNKNNPYYGKAWLTLPLLTIPDDYGISGYTTDISKTADNIWELGGETKPVVLYDQDLHFEASDKIITSENGKIIDISTFSDRSEVSVSIKYNVIFRPTNKTEANVYDDLRMDLSYNEATGIRVNVNAFDYETGRSIYGHDLEGRIISDGVDVIKANSQLMKGHFVKQDNGTWVMEDLFSTFNIKVPQATKKLYIKNTLTKWVEYLV